MSTAPTVRGAGMEARSVTLRCFAVADGSAYRMMPGGLSRAASRADTLVVSSALGAVSKDVWVLNATPQSDAMNWLPAPDAAETRSAAVSPRVAEDLYWLGRYVERAEGLARLLKVCDNRWRDLHPQPDPALARCLVVLLEALTSLSATYPGFVGVGAGARLAAPQHEMLALIADHSRVGTLAFDLGRIRLLAHAVRDQLSNDTWMVLGSLDRVLTPFVTDPDSTPDPKSRPSDEVPAALAHLLEALLAFAGLAAESMVRDAAWHLLDGGRRIERALQVTDLLRACLTGSASPAVEALLMESVLITAESIITHRRRYPARSGVDTVLALLLTDRGNPRSVAFQLDRLGDDLVQLPVDTEQAGLARQRAREVAATLRDGDSVALAHLDGRGRSALQAFLDSITVALMELSDLIDAAHFSHPAPLQSLTEFAAAGAWSSDGAGEL